MIAVQQSLPNPVHGRYPLISQRDAQRRSSICSVEPPADERIRMLEQTPAGTVKPAAQIDYSCSSLKVTNSLSIHSVASSVTNSSMQ